MRRSDAYRFVDKQTRLNAETFNFIFDDLDARLDSVEKIRAILEEEVNSLLEVGLARVNESLGPLIADVTAATELGFLIGLSESDVELIADEAAGLVISEANRAVFQPPPFLVAMVNDDVTKYAVLQRTDWDRETGLLTVDVLFVHGGDPNIQSDDWTVAGSGGIVPLVIELADQVAADKATVAADKVTVAADKTTVAADKVAVAGHKDAAAASAAAAAASAIAAATFDPDDFYTEAEADAAIAAAIAAMVDASPATLDTLNELAAALGDDPNFAATVASSIGGKQAADPDLTALAALASTGIAVRTASDTWAQRTVTAGNGIAVTNGSGVSGDPTVAVDKATAANIFEGTSNKVVTADGIEAAMAPVTIAYHASNAIDLDTFRFGNMLAMTGNRTLDLSNGTPGLTYLLRCGATTSTDRTITFSSKFKGDVPTITDCDNTKYYLLTILCVATNEYNVTATVSAKP